MSVRRSIIVLTLVTLALPVVVFQFAQPRTGRTPDQICNNIPSLAT
jgi:hypothetical protein